MLSDRFNINYVCNSSQFQDLMSVLCGYYCLYLINESNKNKSFYDIIKVFSHNDILFNERFKMRYFM